MDQKARLKRFIITLISVLSAGIVYYIFIKSFDLALPCIIHKLTGLYCAGCGLTRMFIALFQLDFALAAKQNLLALLLIIPIVLFVINKGIKYVKNGDLRFTKKEKVCAVIFLILLVTFAILRNIQVFDFLRPI